MTDRMDVSTSQIHYPNNWYSHEVYKSNVNNFRSELTGRSEELNRGKHVTSLPRLPYVDYLMDALKISKV